MYAQTHAKLEGTLLVTGGNLLVQIRQPRQSSGLLKGWARRGGRTSADVPKYPETHFSIRLICERRKQSMWGLNEIELGSKSQHISAFGDIIILE